MKKKISVIFIILSVAFACAGTAYAKTYLTTTCFPGYDNFEGYSATGLIADTGERLRNITTSGGIAFVDVWSAGIISSNDGMQALLVNTEDKNGSPTKAFKYYIKGTATGGYTSIFQPMPDVPTEWNTATKGKYFIYKAKFKSGSDTEGTFGSGNFEDMNMNFGSGTVNGTKAFNTKEWTDLMYVIDRTGSTDVTYGFINNKLVYTKKANVTIKNSVPRWGAIYASNGQVDSSLYFDDIEIYYEDFSIKSEIGDGTKGVEPTDSIVLDITGGIDESTINNIKVFEGSTELTLGGASYANGKCTLTLAEKMKEFTKYTVDFSGVKSNFGMSPSTGTTSFTTTGKLVLSAAVSFKNVTLSSSSDISSLSSGLAEGTLTITNTTPANADIVMAAVLKNSGKIVNVSYENFSVSENDQKTFTAAFTIPEDGDYSIEMYAGDNITGSKFYTDVYTIDKSGITSASRSAADADWPVKAELSAVENKVSFYSISGSSASSMEKIAAGNIGSAAKIKATTAGDIYYITALKKDKTLTGLSYIKKSASAAESSDFNTVSVLSSADGCTMDVYVWNDIKGTESFITKSVLQ